METKPRATSLLSVNVAHDTALGQIPSAVSRNQRLGDDGSPLSESSVGDLQV